jgi:hypothetical protein
MRSNRSAYPNSMPWVHLAIMLAEDCRADDSALSPRRMKPQFVMVCKYFLHPFITQKPLIISKKIAPNYSLLLPKRASSHTPPPFRRLAGTQKLLSPTRPGRRTCRRRHSPARLGTSHPPRVTYGVPSTDPPCSWRRGNCSCSSARLRDGVGASTVPPCGWRHRRCSYSSAPLEDKNVSLGSTIGTSLGRGNVGCDLFPDALGEERRLLVLFSLLIETASSIGPAT